MLPEWLILIADSPTTSVKTSKVAICVKREKKSSGNDFDKLQVEVLRAELPRIEAEKRKFEVETEVLLLKKKN